MGDSEWEGYAANNKARLAGKGVLGKRDPLYIKAHKKVKKKRRR